MMKSIVFPLILVTIAGCSHPDPSIVSETINYYQQETRKPYDDVLAELKVAIADHNFRITAHSRVGKVIRDRGTQNFPEFDTVQFCNLTHARTLLELSPDAVSYMPCNAVIYQSDNKTIIKTHLLPVNNPDPRFNRFAEKMNTVLKEIVDFAAEE